MDDGYYIFGKNGCCSCEEVKDMFRDNGINFIYCDYDKAIKNIEHMINLAVAVSMLDMTTDNVDFPIIILIENGKLIGEWKYETIPEHINE